MIFCPHFAYYFCKGSGYVLQRLKNVFLNNLSYLFFGIIFIFGFVLGCIFSVDSFDATLLKNGTFTEIFISYFSSVSIYLLIIGFFGFSLAGIFVIPVTVFFRGLGIGSTIVSLYSGLSNGISLSAVIVLVPHFILFALYLIYSAGIYINLSFNLVKLLKYGNNLSDCRRLASSSLKSSVKLIIFVLSSGSIYCFSILFLQSII